MSDTTKPLTPPQLAKRFGVSVHKVLGWIASGEIVAVNMAEKLGGRPRWRIFPEAIEAFLLRRSSKPDVKPSKVRKRKNNPGFVDYFPQDE